MSSQVCVLNTSHVHPVQTDDLSPPCHGEQKLSFLDLLQISKTIQRLFFFDGPDLPPFPSVVSALRSSLAATLAVFLPLAGNLALRPASGDVVLDFSPAAVSSGVKFVEAEFSGGADGMRRLARDAEHDTQAFVQLVPDLEATQLPAPVLAVQVTRPAGAGGGGGAVAVGVSIRHAVADGQAVWRFLRAWSKASREGSASLAAPGFVQPTFDRAGIRHPKAAEMARTVLSLVAPALPLLRSASSKPEIMKQSRRTFLLRADEIRSLKQHILEQSRAVNGGEPCKPPSTYVAISSLAWTSVVRAKPSIHDADDVQLMISADCRNRIRPPLGDAFFGTCVKPCFARARAGDLRRGEGGGGGVALARAAAAIQDAIRAHLEELGGDPLSDAESWTAAYRAVPQERFVAVGSSNRFMAYETDFGWGAPTRVELVSLFVRQMVTLLGANDGGVQVSVALDDAEAMEAFAASFVVPVSLVFPAAAVIKLWSGGSSSNGRAPLWKYWGVSVTNTIGPTMGIEALKYISYPAQVLAKSSKMIPVMLMGTLLYGVKYTLPEYFCTFLVAGGVSSFALLKTSSKTIKKLANPNAPLGYTLCFLNLAFDGYTNSTQDLIKSRYPKTNPWDIMLGMNLWGTIYNAVIMFAAPLLFSNWPYANGFEALRFCQENPEVAWDIFLFCLCGAVGQNFIFLTISRFGSLTNTTITTTRKFMSIVVSSVISGNPLSLKQWGSVVMVFLGLSIQIYLKWKKKKGRDHKE